MGFLVQEGKMGRTVLAAGVVGILGLVIGWIVGVGTQGGQSGATFASIDLKCDGTTYHLSTGTGGGQCKSGGNGNNAICGNGGNGATAQCAGGCQTSSGHGSCTAD